MSEPLPRVFRPRTIRVQLTLAITAVVALVVALAGLAVVLYADHRDRDSVDAALATRVAQVRTAATKSGTLPTDGSFAVRLLDGTTVRAEVGATTKFSIPVKDGYSTVTAADGSHWRSWAEKVKTGAQLQVLINLQDVEENHSGNVVMIDLIVVLAALVAAAGTWFVGGLVMKPLVKLAEGAQAITPDAPEQRLPVVTSPPEVADLGTALNEALDRMNIPDREQLAQEAAQEATEHFAKVAADNLREPLSELGENLDQLLDNPEMTSIQRHLVLAAIQTEYRRITEMVDELQARTKA
ncbi:HAMP domain-containing protein [Actinoplanes sp. NPDC026619]|uniref:HAMP domain-containing protein n=1 Tax=Actinoplanes sp. NPDC026619 TaxID=3155798 RepID=UPI0033EE0789